MIAFQAHAEIKKRFGSVIQERRKDLGGDHHDLLLVCCYLSSVGRGVCVFCRASACTVQLSKSIAAPLGRWWCWWWWRCVCVCVVGAEGRVALCEDRRCCTVF